MSEIYLLFGDDQDESHLEIGSGSRKMHAVDAWQMRFRNQDFQKNLLVLLGI
jgi:hypothetical protein